MISNAHVLPLTVPLKQEPITRSVQLPQLFLSRPFHRPIMIHAVQETQWVGIHDILNAQGFAMHYRAVSKRSATCKFSNVGESFTAKQKDRLLSFLILNVIEAKIFDHVFLDGHNV